MDQLAYSISEVCQVAGIGKTSIYEAIGSGELRAVKRAKRTLILDVDLRRWLEGLPAIAPKPNVRTSDAAVTPTKSPLGSCAVVGDETGSRRAKDDPPARDPEQRRRRPAPVRARHRLASGGGGR
jgi:excisionase family DNA binding protein